MNLTPLPSSGITRRRFLRSAAFTAALPFCSRAHSEINELSVQTVLGPVAGSKLGFTLPHEHVMCDFIGAAGTGRHRWNPDAVVQRMKPFLIGLKQRGITGFVDCTPAYIGRDPRVLKLLAQQTGLHIVTNTGYYGGAGDKFVPAHAYRETADQLADRWMDECKNGIEESGVKPGFIKIGIDEVQPDAATLSAIDEKLVRAAARLSRRTGLSVTCHTGGGPAALLATKVFLEEKASAARWIVAHSDGHGFAFNESIAELGGWVSFDGISRRPLEEHVKLVTAMVAKHADRLLLSHDNGWYWVGEENGGEVRDFNYLADVFLPACRKSGLLEPVLRKLTVENPARALAG